MSTQAAGRDPVQLCINLDYSVAEALALVALGRGVNATEAIRRAVSLLWAADDALLRGDRVLITHGSDLADATDVDVWKEHS